MFNEAGLTCDERDIADLRQLMSLVREGDFFSRKVINMSVSEEVTCPRSLRGSEWLARIGWRTENRFVR